MEWRLLGIYLPSQDDASKTGGLFLCCLTRHLDGQLNDHQTPQGQLLNNFISGSAGGLIGTVLNTPYVRPISPSYSDPNSLLSLLPVSTSAAVFSECSVVVQAHTLYTGYQVSDPGSRESTGSCPKRQLDIACICIFSVTLSCDGAFSYSC